ncbi:MAG: hypothetical protein AAFV88_20255 [Planctomycetota bacterium]
MKAILTAMITCAVIFGLSAGATTFLIKPEEEDVEASGDETATADEGAGLVEEVEGAELTDAPMPVSFRPDASVSIEAVLQMSDSIKRMEQELASREEKVKRDEMRVKLMFDDLATEQSELRALSQGIDSKLELANRLKGDVEAKLMELEDRRIEVEQLSKQANTTSTANNQSIDDRVDDVSSWFANLEPEQAASYLREFANNGKMSFAAALMQKMPDRQKSKILGAMNDPVLIDQLIEALQD